MLENNVHSGLNYYNSLIPSKYKGMILLILIDKDTGRKNYRVFSTEEHAIDEYKLNEEYFNGHMFLLGDIKDAVAISRIY